MYLLTRIVSGAVLLFVLSALPPTQVSAGELRAPILRTPVEMYLLNQMYFRFALINANSTYSLGLVYWQLKLFRKAGGAKVFETSGSVNVDKSQTQEVTTEQAFTGATTGEYRLEITANSEVNITGPQKLETSISIITPPDCTKRPTITPVSKVVSLVSGNTITYTAPEGCCFTINPFMNSGLFYTIQPSSEQTLQGGQTITFTITKRGTDNVASAIGFAWKECTNGTLKGNDYFVITPGIPQVDSQPTAATNFISWITLFGDPVGARNGKYTYSPPPDIWFADVSPLHFQRYYDAAYQQTMIAPAMGQNWAHTYSASIYSTPDKKIVAFPNGHQAVFNFVNNNWVNNRADSPYKLNVVAAEIIITNASENTQWIFSEEGRLQKIDNGVIPIYVQWNGGALVRAYDSLGRSLIFTTDNLSRITSVSDGLRTVSYTYNLLSELINVQLMNTSNESFTYSSSLPGFITVQKRDNKNILQNVFDATGRVSQQVDARNQIWNYEYYPDSSVVINPAGKRETHVFAGSALPSEVNTDQSQTRFLYNPTTLEYQIFGYDSKGLTLTWDSPNLLKECYYEDYKTSCTYEPITRNSVSIPRIKTITTGGTLVTLQTNLSNGAYSHISGANSTTQTFEYLPLIPLRGKATYGSLTTTYARATNGNILSVLFPSGSMYSKKYSAAGDVVEEEYAENSKITQTWNAISQLTSFTDENNRQTKYEYNNWGDLSKVTTPSQSVISYLYSDARDVLEILYDGNKAYTFKYSNDGLPQEVTDAFQNNIVLERNLAGNVVGITDRRGAKSILTYYPYGNIKTVTTPLHNTTTYTYLQRGLLESCTTPMGLIHRLDWKDAKLWRIQDPNGRSTEFTYDLARDLITEHTVANLKVKLGYNENDMLTSVTDPNGNTWKQEYTAEGKLIAVATPDNKKAMYSYDSKGRVATVEHANWSGKTELAYNPDNSISSITYNDGLKLEYEYSEFGGVTRTKNCMRTYDTKGRVISSNGITYTRNIYGWITSITFTNGKTVTYTYDKCGNLSKVADWASGTLELEHNSENALIGIKRSNGVHTTYQRDKDGRVTSIVEGDIATSEISYGNGTRVENVTTTGLLEPNTIAYDISATYNSSNENNSLQYDALGRVLECNEGSVEWNDASEVTSFGKTKGAIHIFEYDGFGRVVSIEKQASLQRITWNDAFSESVPGIIHLVTGTLYCIPSASGTILYVIDSATSQHFFPHYDISGNTVLVTDDVKQVVKRFAYSPYGEMLGIEGIPNYPLTFAGLYGVVNYGLDNYVTAGRLYDASKGIFLAPDPVRSLHPLSSNQYSYAYCNPIQYHDASGRAPEPIHKSVDEMFAESNRRLEEANKVTQERYEREMKQIEEEFAKRAADREARRRQEQERQTKLDLERKAEEERVRLDREKFDAVWRKVAALNEYFEPPKPVSAPKPNSFPGIGTGAPTSQELGGNNSASSQGAGIGANGQPPSASGSIGKTTPQPKATPPPSSPSTNTTPPPQLPRTGRGDYNKETWYYLEYGTSLVTGFLSGLTPGTVYDYYFGE